MLRPPLTVSLPHCCSRPGLHHAEHHEHRRSRHRRRRVRPVARLAARITTTKSRRPRWRLASRGPQHRSGRRLAVLRRRRAYRQRHQQQCEDPNKRAHGRSARWIRPCDSPPLEFWRQREVAPFRWLGRAIAAANDLRRRVSFWIEMRRLSFSVWCHSYPSISDQSDTREASFSPMICVKRFRFFSAMASSPRLESAGGRW